MNGYIEPIEDGSGHFILISGIMTYTEGINYRNLVYVNSANVNRTVLVIVIDREKT